MLHTLSTAYWKCFECDRDLSSSSDHGCTLTNHFYKFLPCHQKQSQQISEDPLRHAGWRVGVSSSELVEQEPAEPNSSSRSPHYQVHWDPALRGTVTHVVDTWGRWVMLDGPLWIHTERNVMLFHKWGWSWYLVLCDDFYITEVN